MVSSLVFTNRPVIFLEFLYLFRFICWSIFFSVLKFRFMV